MYFTTIIKQTKLLLRLSACIAMVGISTANGQAQLNENREGTISTGASGYQNVGVDLFRGRANTSIPLYTYKTQRLSIPITLDYAPVDSRNYYSLAPEAFGVSDGHVYHPGWVGLGWTLSAGGSITRSVKGIPDETYTGNTGDLIGNFLNFDPNYDPTTKPEPSPKYDVDEDEFSFNFAGYSGTFFFYRGEWKVFSKEVFKIEPKYMNNRLYGFLMETPDGITYTFGNYETPGVDSDNENAVEYSQDPTSNKLAISWYLVRVESPEGDQINFNYGYYSNEENFPSVTPIQKQSILYSRMETRPDPRNNYWFPTSGPSLYKKIPTDDEIANGTAETVNSVVYLKSITSNSSPIQVNFEKLLFDEMKYPECNSHKAYKLDKITINLVGENSFKEYKFNYSGGVYATGTPSELLKLSSLQESGRLTSSQALISVPAHVFTYYPDNDEASPNALSQIQYPTGGTVNLEYEGHIYQGVGYIKGFRAKRKIVKSAVNEDALISEYFYTNGSTFPDAIPESEYFSYSSGSISRYETHFQSTLSQAFSIGLSLYRYYMSKTTQYDCAYPSDQSLNNATVPPLQVGYSDVWEVRSNLSAQNVVTPLGYTCNSYISWITTDANGRIIRYNNIDIAGTPIRIRNYDAQRVMIDDTEFAYEDANAQHPQIPRYVSIISTFLDEQGEKSIEEFGTYNTAHTLYRLKSKKVQTPSSVVEINYSYLPGTTKSIVEETEVDVNFDNQTHANNLENTSQAKFSTKSTTYKYTSEFSNWWGTTNWVENLCHQQLNLPVEKVMFKDGKVIGAELIKYETIDITNVRGRALKHLKPNLVYTLEINAPIDISTYQSVATDWSTKDSRFKLKTTYKYDQRGNLIQYQNEGSLPVAYDYDDQNETPLVEINGLTYDNYVTYKNNQNLYADKPDDVNKIRAHFPSAQIKSYTIDPRFGVTSVTTPNGISIYKEYDAFGRLQAIKDTNKKLLKSIEYNYNAQ